MSEPTDPMKEAHRPNVSGTKANDDGDDVRCPDRNHKLRPREREAPMTPEPNRAKMAVAVVIATACILIFPPAWGVALASLAPKRK